MMMRQFLSGLIAVLGFASAALANNGTMDEMTAAISRGDYKDITSVLVLKDGKIVYERYFGQGGPQYLNNTRSATKSITSMAVGAAIEQGGFSSVDDKVMPFFRVYDPIKHLNDTKKDIRLKDLLTMSSALDCNDNDQTTPGYEDKMHQEQDWTRFVLDLPTMPGWSRDASGLGPFRYCTAGSFLAGQAIEMAVGQSLDDFIDAALFTPLGITRYEWYRSPMGEEQAGGGLELTSRDLMKFGQLALQNGVWNGRRLLPEGWITESTTAHRKVSDVQSYGYHWWIGDFFSATTGLVHKGYYMAGNGGSKVAAFEDMDMVVVITAERYNTPDMHQQSNDLLQGYILPAFELGAVH
ncbi:serine hydrolase [Kordiimonas lacus]|uniref:serine hydrolase domain-containing protein n=2 Tax=Kordiimonas TaxID=288021 RepID=UPI002FDA88F8